MLLLQNHVLNFPIYDADASALYWDKLNQICLNKEIPEILEYFTLHEDIISHIFSISPYLSDNIILDIDFYQKIHTQDPQMVLENLLQQTHNSGEIKDQRQIMRELRLLKKRVATLCAIMDICQIWSVMHITEKLSQFADAVSHSALNHILYALHDQGAINLNQNEADPASTSGVCILGMGKLGGFELNYSSDIDLIAFYDMDKIDCDDENRFKDRLLRTFKNFITVLEHSTADGYVFRTDFRLRPNPSMTPIIMHKNAMLHYYETTGLNWERSAMIKARPVAGNLEVGFNFLSEIKSFIWRKNLDFMALEDIYNIKNKINTHRTNFNLKLYGHNIKLGLGGIREIEFYAQSQQLIWGGRVLEFRTQKTLETLEVLNKHGHISTKDKNALHEAYLYLRVLEHRLQMVADEQTHTLPETIEKMHRISAFMGYDSIASFETQTLYHLQTVTDIYTNLFSDKNIGQKEIIGTENIFQKFKNPSAVNTILSHWQSGVYRATRSDKSKQLLIQLEGQILNAFLNTEKPDETLLLFDKFLEKLPSGVQLFSLFKSNPELLHLIARIMGSAPRIGERLVQHPNLLDSLLTGRYLEPCVETKELQRILQNDFNDARDFQDILETSRRFKSEFFFEQGMRVLENKTTPAKASVDLSSIADVVLQGLIPNTVKNMQYNAGNMLGGDFAIVAMGKLGSNEMTYQSDVDLIFIYNHPDKNAKSDGKRSLVPTQYYTGLCQRIITAISSMTGEGQLFEADMRLRPNGNSGAIATALDSFINYYDNQSWTWEKLALTRGRIVYSSSNKLRDKIEQSITHTLSRKWDNNVLRKDIVEMRNRMQKEFNNDNPFNIKQCVGGLIDVEFIAQTYQLLYAHKYPKILHNNTHACYNALLQHNIINIETHEILTKALVLWQNIQGILRMTTTGEFYENNATFGQIKTLLNSTNHENMSTLHNTMNDLKTKVRHHFNTLLKMEN